ncbi:hypothetical protein EDC04DRAFT_2031905 [Pisolithus marmoratus]|nr:hypothetical protein EDC04DRAFT_2031905 [Pisolithus marmoratus]
MLTHVARHMLSVTAASLPHLLVDICWQTYVTHFNEQFHMLTHVGGCMFPVTAVSHTPLLLRISLEIDAAAQKLKRNSLPQGN